MTRRLLALATILLVAFSTPAYALKPLLVQHADGSYALVPSDKTDARVLAAGVGEIETVPTYTDSTGATRYANYVVFSSTCDLFAKMNNTASIPASDITDGTASELNPTVRYLGGAVTTIGLKSATPCTVTLMFYR
jgi:hypothetical protein